MEQFKLGQKVMWSGGWGTDSPKPAKIVGWVEDNGVVLYDLDNGHWAYGYQLQEINADWPQVMEPAQSNEECVDGLVMFAGGGRIALDAIRYDDDFVLNIYVRKSEHRDRDTYRNIAYMNGRPLDQFDNVGFESFKTREALLNRMMQLVSAANPF
jgi:hypothetical protein